MLALYPSKRASEEEQEEGGGGGGDEQEEEDGEKPQARSPAHLDSPRSPPRHKYIHTYIHIRSRSPTTAAPGSSQAGGSALIPACSQPRHGCHHHCRRQLRSRPLFASPAPASLPHRQRQSRVSRLANRMALSQGPLARLAHLARVVQSSVAARSREPAAGHWLDISKFHLRLAISATAVV